MPVYERLKVAAQLAGQTTAIFDPRVSARMSAAGRAPHPSQAVPIMTGGRVKRPDFGRVAIV
jgi:hypothetical protein